MNEGLKMMKQSTENKPVIFNKPRIYKNLLVLSFSFFLVFTACQGLNVLQSTINRKHGIGTAGQGVVYVSFCIASVLLPKYTIKKLGCKMCLLLGMASFIPYLGANFSPNWYTIVSAAIFLGTGASIMWGTLCTYINLLSVTYCEICDKISKNNHSNKLNDTQNDIAPDKNSRRTKSFTEAISKEKLQNGLLGVSNITNSFDELVKKDPVYYGTYRNTGDINKSLTTCKNIPKDNKFENSSVYGTVDIDIPLQRPRTFTNRSLIEFQRIYKTESVNARFFGFHGFLYHSAMIFSNVLSYCLLTSDTYNETDFLQNSTYICGAQYCDQGFYHNQEEITGISSEKRYALVGISLGIGTLGVILLLLFLDDLGSKKEQVSFSLDLLLATVFHSIKKEQASLITLTLYYGLFEGFFIGDFTKSYVGCALGTYYIGIIAVVFGIGCALSSTISGILVKYIGRWPIFLGAQMINLGINISLLMWIPKSKMIIPFFIIASAWGMFTGIMWSQLKAFYGTMFKGNEEVAFASYFVWTSVGYILSFSYSHYLCAFIKIYISIAVSCAGFLGYAYAEWILYTRKSTERE